MRIGLIQIKQETSSFNPTPTTLADFEHYGLYEGRQMLEHRDDSGPGGGYLDAIARASTDIETVAIIRGSAQSGGRLSADTFEFFDTKVRDGLSSAGHLDGIVMLLHGAASAAGVDDVEGAILATARRVVGDDMPIAVMLDHHANITAEMIEHSDIIMGFRTQPHDPFETARDLTELGLAHFAGEIAPTMAWRNLPMLTHQEQYLTARGPMKTLFDRAREMETDPRVLSASPFPMQPWLDAAEGGWSMVVVTDGDEALADELADELAEIAWSMRDDFLRTESLPVDDAVAKADASPSTPILLSDTGDSVPGGSTGDSTVILESMVRTGITGTALVPMVDAVAAEVLTEAGVGATVTIQLGGRLAPFFTPLEVTGVVRGVGDGVVEPEGHQQSRVEMGRTVAFEVGNVTVLVTEFGGLAGIHPACYRHVGVEPGDHTMIVMKTASNFQYMAEFTTEFIRVATPGPTQSEIELLPWANVPRPIFPLDPIESWRVGTGPAAARG